MGSLPYTNLVLFDGACNLCNGFVQFLIRRDPQERFTFGVLEGNTARQIHTLTPTPTSQQADSVIYLRNGIIYTHSDAVLRILGDLGGFWKVSVLGYMVPRGVRNSLYRFMARHRHRWWKKQRTCLHPATVSHRFVD